MKSIFSTIIILLSSCIIAQDAIRIGDWESHLPRRISLWVTQSDKYVYASTGNSIMQIDKQEIVDKDFVAPSFITKIDGLTESIIDKLAYDKYNQQLIVIYSTSNIDLLKGETITNIPYIKDNNAIIGSKAVNDIAPVDADNIFLACSFGLINIDSKTLDFRYTTFTPSAVQTVIADDTYIYMGLEDGCYRIAKDDPNPIDFSRWQMVGPSNGLPIFYNCKHLELYNNHIYIATERVLYKLVDNGAKTININIPNNFDIAYMTADGQKLIVGVANEPSRRAAIRALDGNDTFIEGGADCAFEVQYGIEDQFGQIWYADRFRGLRYTEGIDYGCNILEFDSPFDRSCSQIEVGTDRVYFASGGASDNYALQSNRSGFYMLEGTKWNNVNETRYPVINQNEFLNHVSIAPHRDENKVYTASYYSGLMEYNIDNEELVFYGKENSKIDGILPTDRAGRVAFVMFDKDDNLWMSNFGAPKPIVVLTKEGTWHNFEIPTSNTNLAKMAIDDNGYIWFTQVGNNGGVVVYDPGESIVDPTDDRVVVINEGNSELPSPLVNSLAVDLDGEMWVGTSQGPVIFDCDVFGDNCRGSRRKVLQDGIPAFLLDTEEILCIEVDGANRKWMGSKNGIFVQSPDGETQVLRYTEENSPLFDNTVIDMDFDNRTGRMYISTDQGVQSLRTESTGSRKIHETNNVYAFPNPVASQYLGPIAVKGLGRNAIVKITDITGKLVYETDAQGGQVIWDGNDYTGRRAAPGVYLVFSTSKVSFDTPDSYVTKIMLLE